MESTPNNDNRGSRYIDIPKIFYSDLSGKPLSTCVSCGMNLIESNQPYVVEKSFRYYAEYDMTNTIFEYGICMPCAFEMHTAMSEESLEKIQQYFNQINLRERSQELWNKHNNKIEPWISTCIIKQVSSKDLEEYQICAQFIGDKLHFDLLPYMLGIDASNEIANLLSNKTLDEFDRFVDEHFGLPPDIREAIKTSPSVLL